ncbi:IPT/TIG domain-containing protein [Tunturibacter psychrotolerans]|uniref:IPT/TIG domain-containing protein n=1 Tax=Tunturiibacter psychrotolerans TaxID=3069686 RepID=A0AAU7ZNF9_9BACT
MRLAKTSLLVLTLLSPMRAIGQVSVLTQHNDNARTGQNLNETTLNTSNVSQNSFGKLFSRTVDGFIYAQPLYVPGLTIQGATHNVVYVATQHNSVYAFDADNPNTPAPLWQVNLGTPVPSQDICIISGDTNPADCPYYDISPEIGITSTPVIDPVAGIIYLVDRTKNTTNSTYHDYLHALSLTTGAEELAGPVEITGQVAGTGTGSSGGIVAFQAAYQHQRPALLLENGVLYLAFGSVGDIGGVYHGWVMSYNASTLQQEAIFNVTPDGDDGGMWSAGQGPVADSSGNIYMMTGNGDFNANTGGTDYGDSFIKFSGSSLAVSDYFTPDTQATLNADNTDLGSGGPMLMPGTSLLVGMGKDATLRVVNSANMGHYNSSTNNDVQEFSPTSNAFFSSPIYWNSPNFGPVIYIWGAGDYLKAFQFKGSTFATTPVSQGTSLNSSGDPNAAALSISADGSMTGTGVLWSTASISQWAKGTQVPGIVRAFDATNLTDELWNSTQNLARDDVGNSAKFNPPTIANGKVYVGSFSGQLQVYGLNPPAFQGVQFVQVASATPQSTQTTVPVPFTGAQTAGDLNVVIVGWNDTTAAVQSVADSAGNTYTLALGPTKGTGLSESIYYAKSILASTANTVTVTFNQGATKPDVRILEYSGVATFSPLDVSTGASGNTYIADSGYVNTNAANELIVGASMVQSNTTVMAGAPFTPRVITSPDSDLAADRLVNVPGSYHSWEPLNAAGNWVMQVVTFKAASTSTVPFVSSVTPNAGPLSGGTAVTITGIDFAAGATVAFGSTAATNVTVVNSTTITATTPAGSAGAVTVTVTNSGGQSGSLAGAFTYAAPPTVSGVSPNSGSTSGGTAVTVTGTNFASGSAVKFGSAAATSVTVVNSTTITATTPAGSAGAATATVTVNGQSGNLASAFTYIVEPTVSSVSPNSGPVAGGTSVTITGTNFASGATVTFGSTAATAVTVVNSTTITATTPAGSAGATTVTVAVNGQSGSLASAFTYIGQPTLTSVSPNNGPASGGTAVTLTGTNFAAGATVKFGSTAATSVTVVSSTSITAATPAGSVGAVTVTVTNSGGQTGSLTNGYTYNASVPISFTQVASATPQTTSATVSVSYPAAQTAGDLNVVVVGWNDTTSTVQSVKDSAGNTYSLAIGPTVGTGLQESIYYAANIAGGSSNAVTVTFSQAAAFPDVRILEYRGVTTLDVTAGTTGSSAAASSGAATTTSANELIFGADYVSTTTTAAGSGFTSRIITTPDGDIAEDKIVTTAGSNSATATLSGAGPWVMQMVTFFATPSGPAPTVSSVTPNSGSTAGGTAVTITGTNFVAGATVTFGSTAATSVAVVNATTITATAPAGSAGAATVTVTNSGGQSGSLASAFTYIAPPTVTSVSPNGGPLAGGTPVTITGTNFAAGATVTFGSTAATSVTVVNATTITATTPAGSAGAVTVTVTNSNGLSGNLASGFTFAPAPTVSSVSPNTGSTAGGTAITITGTNFAPGATVEILETRRQATNVVVVNSTTITATTPTGNAGAVTVTVAVNGQSGNLANGFTYIVSPTVSSVSPNSGPVGGGTTVTITGTNFATGAAVTFGSTSATNVTVVNSTTITATTPAGSAGAVTVTVTVNGQSGSLAGAFTYAASPTVSSVSPNSGSTSGGTAVTIMGTNFVAGAAVTFGSAAATSVTVVNSTTITATTPAGTTGAATVTVTNSSGQSGSLASAFTYIVKPTVTSVSPNSGPVAGGTSVTITGTNFASGATVTFGSTAATAVTVVNSTTITATTPAGSAGATMVTVAVNGQSGSLASAFTYIGQPTLISVSPNNGPASGGTAVTLTGTNFAAGATVKFGSTAATSVTVVSSTSITAATPAGSVGAVTVTVTNSGGQTGSLTNGYTYNASVPISFTQVASATPQAASATVSVSYPAAQTAGDLNVVAVGWNDTTSTVQSVKDSAGNTYSLAIGPTVGTGLQESIYYAANIAGGSGNAVTVTFSQAAAFPDVRILEYRGVTTLDVTAGTSGSSAAASSGAATTTSANELIFGADYVSTTTTAAGSGFTSRIITTPDGDIAEDKIVTTAGSNSATATLSGSGPWVMQMVTFSATPSGPAPTVSSVTPNSGSTAGGTAVTITGTNFVAGATVTFGSTAGTSVVVVNSTTITATAPAASAGAATVTVTNSGGQSGSLASAFTYIAPPTVTSVSPNGGPLAGGTAVTITGTNFAAGATVTFGSTAATSVTVVNATTITATTPAGSAGAVTVTVTNSNGLSGNLASGFTFAPAPTVSSVSPNTGSTAGGTAITITGTNFAPGATVEILETRRQATNVVVVNSTTITATTPTGNAGAVTVTVAVNGQSGNLANGFTYIVSPTVSSVSPNSGPVGGGTTVTITGTNFATGAAVTFGSTSATNVTVVNSTTITATTPAGSAGAVTVTVTVNGQSGSLAGAFTYAASPTVSSVSPNSGSTSGGTAVTIMGTNFVAGAAVTFGSAAATSVTVVNSTTITATTPAGTTGAATVTVTNSSGQSGSLASAFTYIVKPTVTSVSPNSGPVAGGTSVTITGTNFASGATVTFGSTAATAVTVVNSTTITATTPAGSAGATMVTVAVNGQSGSLASAFTYIGQPTLISVSPNNGPASGGTAVTLTGTNFAAGATVKFGSTAATSVTVVSSTSITAATPAGSVGAVTVTVTNSGGQTGSLTNGYTYNASVPISFTQVASATPQAASATVSVSYPAAQTAGDLNVVAVGWNDTTSTVQSVKDSAGNTYSLAIGPTVGTGLQESIYYAANIAGGSGNAVTVTFSQAAAFPDVRILEYRGVTTLDVTAGTSGSSAAASSGAATTTSANELIFGADYVSTTTTAAGSGFTSRIITTPDGDIAEDKIVTTAGSNSATATLSGSGPWVMQMVTFSATPSGPAPTVSSVTPNSGSTAGGTAVTITGTNFVAGATVTFGSTAGTSVVVVNSTTITATAPAASAGAATVTVTNSGGQSGSLASAFTYIAPPTVTSVSPNGGPLAGGTAVTITGTNFAAGATVTFGGTAATSVTVVNTTTITATTPAGSAGAVTVTVTNSNGLSGNLASAFTFAPAPTVTSVSPNTGSTAGGTAVTITGTNFAAGATVTFASTAATSVVVVNTTTITATTPTGSAGAVTVTVTNPGNQSGSLTTAFTYVVTAGITAPGNFSGALMGTSVPTYVAGQQYYNATKGTSFTSSSFNSTGADLLVMFLGCHNNTIFTVTDSYGNTWFPLAGPAFKVGSSGFPMEGEFFYAPNAKTGTGHTVTVGLSQPEPLVMSIAALLGDNIYSPIDAYSFITGDNGTIAKYISSSPLITSQPNDLLLGIVKGFGNNTYTAGTAYTGQAASTGLNFSAETGVALTVGNYSSSFIASAGDFWQTVIAAIAPKPNEAVFSWTPSTGGIIASYLVERCTGLNCSNFSQIGSVSAPALTYTDTTISSGTVYSYRVRAQSSTNTFSAYSIVQPLSPVIPYIVSGFAANSLRALSWNASGENGGSISQYSIERCAGAGCSNFSQIAATSSTSYIDVSAAGGTTYTYRARAQDVNAVYGPYSVAATVTIPAYFDNAADGGNNGGSTTSLTYAYTVGANSNRLLLVNLVGDSSADDISSVTYGGASMTLVTKVHTPTPNQLWHYLYYLLSPVSGKNNVVITAASSHNLISEATSWYNVAQSGQPQAFTTATAASGVTLTTSLPASSNNAIVAESMWAPVQVLPSTGSTELVEDSAFQSLGMFSSVPSPVTQAFPLSMTNTWGGQDSASSIMSSFFLASNGTAGIAYDNSADGGNNGGSTTSLTYSYTVGSGLNRLLIVNLIGDNVADDISAVTYAGVPMTLVGKIQAPSSNNWQYLYYLVNPSSGSNNIVVTAASAHYLISEAASWFNVKQIAQPDASTTNTAAAASTSITTSLTTVASGSLVVQGLWSYGHLAAGAGATQILVDAAIGGAGIFVSSGSPVSPAGNVSMTTISDGTQSTGVIMASFAPAP